MSLASRLRALERNTERLRRQLMDHCPECGARVEEGGVGVIIVDESLPPDGQANELARACLLDRVCPSCDFLVDDEGRALPGQAQDIKVIILGPEPSPENRVPGQ